MKSQQQIKKWGKKKLLKREKREKKKREREKRERERESWVFEKKPFLGLEKRRVEKVEKEQILGRDFFSLFWVKGMKKKNWFPLINSQQRPQV